MWLPTKLYDLFTLSSDQRLELQRLRIENEHLTRESAEAKANFKWTLVRINALELERQSLLDKVYAIKVAAPQVMAQPNTVPDFTQDIFTDLDELADASKRVNTSLPPWGN
jgi:hypothetical protein